MSLRNAKDEIIDEIRNLRTMIGKMLTSENDEQEAECQRQLNKIHDKVFNI